jgi:hypothetical protein
MRPLVSPSRACSAVSMMTCSDMASIFFRDLRRFLRWRPDIILSNRTFRSLQSFFKNVLAGDFLCPGDLTGWLWTGLIERISQD